MEKIFDKKEGLVEKLLRLQPEVAKIVTSSFEMKKEKAYLFIDGTNLYAAQYELGSVSLNKNPRMHAGQVKNTIANILMVVKKPLVSIIITTKNEEKNIGNCLESIRKQDYSQDRIEVIVVDNNSTDQTKEIARKYTKNVYNYPDLRKNKNIKNFRGAQLNFGVKKSKGEIIFFPDADMTFDRELVREAATLISNGYFEALFVPEEIIGRGLIGKIRNFERSFYEGTCIDAVRIIKRDLFINVGGFDETGIAFGFDDWDFSKRIRSSNAQIGITKNKLYHHEERLTLREYLGKKARYVAASSSYIQKWGKNDPDIKKQFGFWYRYFGVFLENGKWKRLIRHPFSAAGMYFLRIGVGLVFFKSTVFKKFFKMK